MSSMLEQAIIDATDLREAALKNAEQSVIEKYAPEIKSAVDSLLSESDKEQVIQEQELGEIADIASSEPPLTAIDAPFAAADQDPNRDVSMELTLQFNAEDFDLDLEEIQQASTEEDIGPEDQQETEDLFVRD